MKIGLKLVQLAGFDPYILLSKAYGQRPLLKIAGVEWRQRLWSGDGWKTCSPEKVSALSTKLGDRWWEIQEASTYTLTRSLQNLLAFSLYWEHTILNLDPKTLFLLEPLLECSLHPSHGLHEAAACPTTCGEEIFYDITLFPSLISLNTFHDLSSQTPFHYCCFTW